MGAWKGVSGKVQKVEFEGLEKAKKQNFGIWNRPRNGQKLDFGGCLEKPRNINTQPLFTARGKCDYQVKQERKKHAPESSSEVAETAKAGASENNLRVR